ncbi:MAG: exonuclease domain-containing protein [Nannocystales bacterium]
MDLDVLVLDAQATGASPRHGNLLELGWAWAQAHETDVEVRARLIAQSEGSELPKIITRVTGIDDTMLERARPLDEVWSEVAATCAKRAPTRAVIHCARFELSFLQSLMPLGKALPFDTLCTLELARRLLPGLPRRGLRALAGYFGLGVEQLRRSEDHVRATAFVWHHLAAMLAGKGIEDWDDAVALTHEDAPKRGRKEFPIPRETRLALPDEPGVYRMLRSNGDVLYVGKATSLKRRVNSYFQKQSRRDERVLELLSQVRDLDITRTATPLEAALLETDTIKLLEPPYNVALLSETREPCFVSRDLLEVSTEHSDASPLGPIPSSWRQRRFVGLSQLLAGDTSEQAVARAFGWTPEELPEDILVEGLRAFEDRNVGAGRSAAGFRAAGMRRWNTQARKEDPAEGVDEDDDTWDVARVLRNLEDTLVFFALELRRGAWLRRLSNASMSFDDGVQRTLVMRGGRVRSRRDGHQLKLVRPGVPTFDIATYDRLRVLTTELRRVVQDGGSVSMQFAGGRVLSPDAVARMLPWV